MRVYFFGCWTGHKGHFLYDKNGQTIANRHTAMPWKDYDACLCPNYAGSYITPEADQVQGEAALHHKGGWTALCFWDRSVDLRGGCNSGFYAEGTYCAEEMIKIARDRFPGIWSRFTFEVRVVSRPDDVVNVKYACSVCGRAGVGAVLDTMWQHDPPGWFRSLDGRYACSVECATKASES